MRRKLLALLLALTMLLSVAACGGKTNNAGTGNTGTGDTADQGGGNAGNNAGSNAGDDAGDTGDDTQAPAGSSVQDLYDSLQKDFDVLESLSPLKGEVLEAAYPGLSGAAGVEELLVMEPEISFSAVAVALVKLSPDASEDQIQAVKDILQARLDSQASGGAYYLDAQASWGQGVVAAHENYVGMFVCSGQAYDMANGFLGLCGSDESIIGPDDGEDSGGQDPVPGGPAIPLPGGGADKDGESGEGGSTQAAEPGISHTDVTLFSQGETFQLLPTNVSGTYAAVYASGDGTVATVSENGTVTAMAPGTATVTLHLECESGQYDFSCIVRCRWEADVPAGGDADTTQTPSPSATPSIGDFFASLSQTYEALQSLGAVEGEILDAQYPGLSSAAGVEDVMVMEPVISFSAVAVGLVKMADGASADQIQAVKDIFQARLDSQANGGAYYLGAQDSWGQGVVVAAGNYVGMFVMSGGAQDMADAFAAAYGG